MAKKRRRKGKGCGIFLIAILLSLAIYIVLIFLPVFNVTRITVTGNNVLKSETVLQTAQLYKGTNIFRIGAGKAKRNLKKMPYIKDVKIKKRFPSGIDITITEEICQAYIVKGDTFVGINPEGKVLESTKTPREGVMQIPGIKIKADKIGETIKYENENLFTLQNQCFKEINKGGLFGRVAILDISNSSNIKLTIDNGLVAEIGGSGELEYKIKMIKTVIDEGYSDGVFNISNTSQPTFRKK